MGEPDGYSHSFSTGQFEISDKIRLAHGKEIVDDIEHYLVGRNAVFLERFSRDNLEGKYLFYLDDTTLRINLEIGGLGSHYDDWEPGWVNEITPYTYLDFEVYAVSRNADTIVGDLENIICGSAKTHEVDYLP